MRKADKRQAESFLKVLAQAHEQIKKSIVSKNIPVALDLLEQCQSGAIELGTLIESQEGEGFVTVSRLEEYCELVYQIHEKIAEGTLPDAIKTQKNLKRLIIQIENSIKNDISERTVAVFLPYKASMWDSLESVWMAAEADSSCDAYVIPIPYFDKNPDGSFREEHYEGELFPEYVPVTKYDAFDFETLRPDMIFIHNPYDDCNYVTSVHPFFYSKNIKQFTDCLVYIPYYVTSGGMSEGQALCPAYLYADYIVIQAEKYRSFFDPSIPKEKLLPLGSPKLDRVIRLCENPPEPSKEWKSRLEGKKVYFYNTSINGMLANTPYFLRKVEYVFRCFQGKKDVCLIWRPHPLLESTFDSLRKEYRSFFDELKRFYIEHEIGIYDDTPDLTKTIALCDGYIGDAGSSVTTLFGITGKPLFILDNSIHTVPAADDWKGQIIKGFSADGHDQWMITQGNKLYHSPDCNYHYTYYCELSENSSGSYYARAIEIDKKIYVCPANAQDILVIREKKIIKKIRLNRRLEQTGAFISAREIEGFLYLIPLRYPAIVRYDTTTERLDYIEGYNDVFVKNAAGEWKVGGSCIWNGYVLLASPTDDCVLAIEGNTGKVKILHTGAKKMCGCRAMAAGKICGDEKSDGEIWMMSYEGMTVACWNPSAGEITEYDNVPAGFICKRIPHGYACDERPFSAVLLHKNKAYFSPFWGNMFLCLDRTCGTFSEWIPPFPVLKERKNGYYETSAAGSFLYREDTVSEWKYRYFSFFDRKMYSFHFEEQAYEEIELQFDPDELKAQEPGFMEESDWLSYCCRENVFQTLEQYTDGIVLGNPFEKERQVHAFGAVAANHDGTSGEKIYRFVCEKNTGGKGI